MNVKELRVGNIVTNNVETFQIKEKDLMFLLAFDNEHYAEPVAISPEWLIKTGFKYTDGEFASECIWKFKSFEIWQHDEGYCHSYASGGDVNYIHQLQNLYFYLTGEELTVNL